MLPTQLGFCPLGPAALCLRMMRTLFLLKCEGSPDWGVRTAVLLVAWGALVGLQVLLGTHRWGR